MSNEDKMREEFHAYMTKHHGAMSITLDNHVVDGIIVWHYALGETEAAWTQWKYCAAIKDAEIARLTNELNSERNKHAELQARCFDQGGTFSSVFDKEHLPTNKTAIEERIVSDDIEQAKMHGEGVARSIQGLLEQLREYKKGATFWRTAYFELQEVKEAEIAAQALMIKELREAALRVEASPYSRSGIEFIKAMQQLKEALAKTEHYNPRST